MNNQQRELSLKFYGFLCDIIGTKKIVNKRRQIFNVLEGRDRVQRLVSSGSKAEGLDLKGSDFDGMLVAEFLQVFEKLQHVKYSDKSLYLIMITENVKPGFTKLLISNPQSVKHYSHCIDERTGRAFLSSTLFRQTLCDLMPDRLPGFYIHGPCTTSPDGMFDGAISLYCKDWITQALPWITRTKYSWASDEVIRNILSSGVLFVPIGIKHSPTADLEWRISFSYAEKELIFCFNHVQLLCYALLKIMLNDIIKKKFGDLLCSYFMKTIMFWLCEETEVTYWRKENMLLCFMTCFRRLIYCVKNETCLHYFISENNLFENRFETKHSDLLSQLHGLHDIGWTCLLQTDTLQTFNCYLQPSLLSNISVSTFFPSMTYLDVTSLRSDKTPSIKIFISKSMRSKKQRDVLMYHLSKICQFLAQEYYDEESAQGNNKKLYRNLRQSLFYLQIGLNTDAVSGWLLLASFFLKNQQYNISKTLINHSLGKFTSERCELCHENNFFKIKRYIEIHNTIGLKCLKHYTINDVLVRKHSSIIPHKYIAFIRNDNAIGCSYPSLVFAHLLNCMLYYAVGNYREQERSHRCLMDCINHYEQFG